MCLILFAVDAHPDYPLVIAANRDEFHRRPSTPAGFWPDARQVFAGRDQERSGTWLGITAGGRVAMVTNVRGAKTQGRSPRSRGLLVSDYLTGGEGPAEYLARLSSGSDLWEGFNLVVGEGHRLHYWSNRSGAPEALGGGVFGLSNHLLDTPWPKVRTGREGLTAALTGFRSERALIDDLFVLLADRTAVADEQLPDTGVGLDWERRLAPLFIRSADYGTRCSTIILMNRQNEAFLVERRFDGAGAVSGETAERLRLP